ncbi:uncharacterized protein LOC129596293 [Paramacrobiotus metropolitanus]|uniref:uncharacterized protein LOC129596293 n=1 Tax=Paramacrobiotus metropolitanus TaxID=2943436 RepID=UPI0024465420|nr:uncharacterized protein LOC129596293 [Paramacrobiotus metropolitanus]
MHEYTSPRRQKHQPTRIFLANTFLANISLDGSHRDTKYRALVELYEKDTASLSSTPTSQDDLSAAPDALPPSAPPPTGATTPASLLRPQSLVAKVSRPRRGAGVRRSNSMRSGHSRKSTSLSSSSLDSLESETPGTTDDEEGRDKEFPLKEFKGRRGPVRNLREEFDQEQVLVEAKAKRARQQQRRSSSGSHSKSVKTDFFLGRREKASRTISGSSAESALGRAATVPRSGSISPPPSAGLPFLSASPPIIEARDDFREHDVVVPVEMSVSDALAHPGEILDNHRGVVTEKREFRFVTTVKNEWPVGQYSYISKYKLEPTIEETSEKVDVSGRTVTYQTPPDSLMQRFISQFTRNNSINSVASSRPSAPSPDGLPLPASHQRPTPTLRRPWPWPLKSRLAAVAAPHPPPIRPRRVSVGATSIHIDTEAEALENLLGIKLSTDPEDDLSYEHLLVPLAWGVDYIGDLTQEEAQNLLNTGEISVMNKLLVMPAHPNSFDEAFALSKLWRREVHEYRPKYCTVASQDSSRSSQEQPARVERHFSVDAYKPGVLDDPEWEIAVRRQNVYLESFFSSVISNDLEPDKKKDALNDLFRSKFPHIQLTFSKFKSLKRDMQKACTDQQIRLDLAVVALSYVYFEKLVLRGFINKPNRKILASVCVVLAAKMNDLSKEEHRQLFHSIQAQLRVERTELNAFEFPVMVALGLDLHVPLRFVRYHYDRLMAHTQTFLPPVYQLPLPDPCPRPPARQRLSLTLRPIRQMTFPTFTTPPAHRVVNPRPAPKKTK